MCQWNWGASFIQLSSMATTGPLSGSLSVALAPEFSQSGIAYAASDSPGGGIFRLAVGRDSLWQPLTEGLPSGAMFGGLAVSDKGIVYASSFQQVDSSLGRGGLERSFESSAFDRLADGLPEGATLWGLWLAGSRLWSIDTTNNRLMTLNDSLAVAPTLVAPADGSGEVAVSGTLLDWETLEGASAYRWQLDDDRDFSNPVEGTTASSLASLSELETGETYYWRVRVTAPLPGPWSEAWSFSTLSPPPPEPPPPPAPAIVSLVSPASGAYDVPLRPVFLWTVTGEALSFELAVSREASFQVAEISRAALIASSWQTESELDAGTTYYWRVRAADGQWSSTAVFTTLLPPPAATNAARTPPVVVQNNAGSDGLLYALVLLGGAIVLLLAAVLFIMVWRRRQGRTG